MAKFYKIENDIIKYVQDKCDKGVEVQEPENREKIIRKANLLGDFQEQATYDRIKPEFFLKRNEIRYRKINFKIFFVYSTL
jgi:hypothetical protein